MTQVSPRPRKRSGSITVTTLMATAAVSLTACDDAPQAQWDKPEAPKVEAATFTSLSECAQSGQFTAQQCDAALAEAEKNSAENAPKFAEKETCEERYGVDQCVPRSNNNGSFFTPLLTGFIIGQMFDGGGGGYRGAPMYRDRDGEYYSGSGGRISRDYVTGKARVPSDSLQAPTRVQTRSAVISRHGFGGSGRSYGG